MDWFDFVVVGGGIAGLSAVVRLAEQGRVLCVTKESFGESNTAYAQGGIAVAMGGAEDVALHLEDTLAAGDGLVNRTAAKMLVEQGPRRVEELLGWGTEFDRGAGGELLRTREGAHSLSRILHANGDATGREIARALLKHVRGLEEAGKREGGREKSVQLMEWTTTVDLVIEDGRVAGVTLLTADGEMVAIRAGAVLIASGGAGQVYSDTTNPAVATGDGIAMAYRAGAALEDMEFYQFHPTAFAMEGAPRFLLSEALRGEGALLVNAAGERFMPAVHPLAELAPRDVVARAITREGLTGPVYLDMRHVTGVDLGARFPGISGFLRGYGVGAGEGSDSGSAGGALLDGGDQDGCAGEGDGKGAVCGGGGGLYGSAWGESAGEQLAAGRAGFWGGGGGGDGGGDREEGRGKREEDACIASAR